MNKLVGTALLCAALAACGETAQEPAPAEATPNATAAAAPSSAGTYDVTMKDGTKLVAVLNADGTYEDTAADGSMVEKGTWEDLDGKVCFDAEGDKSPVCFAMGEAQADGSQVATPNDGTDPLTVKKVS